MLRRIERGLSQVIMSGDIRMKTLGRKGNRYDRMEEDEQRELLL